MDGYEKKLLRKAADARVKRIAKYTDDMAIKEGWIRFVRITLGMTMKQLGKFAGISALNVAQTEKREAEDRVTVKTLRKLADAMNCDLVYAFIPRKPFETLIDEQAEKKAIELMMASGVHMELENQKPRGLKKERLELLKEDLKQRGKVW